MNRGKERIPGLQVVLAGAQLVLALLATALDLVLACGACSKDGIVHVAIALAGVLAYGALLSCALVGKRTLFHLGVFSALVVHATLFAILVLEGRICIPCVLAFVGATALSIDVVRSTEFAYRKILSIMLAAGAGAALMLLAFSDRPESLPTLAAHQERAVRASITPHGPEIPLEVYEASHCSYCRSFREDYLPLLEADYKGRLAIRFHEASTAGWVQRTPTFVLGGKLLFEGLPYHYQDLAAAVDTELAGQHR